MHRLSIRPRRAAIAAACCLSALSGLLWLAPGPGDADNERLKEAYVAPHMVLPQTSGPGVRVSDSNAANSPVGRVSRSPGAITRQPTDDPPYSPVTVLESVVQRAQQSGDRYERFEAIITLGESGEAAAEFALVDLLQDNDPEIREAAVESLGVLGASRGLSHALTDTNELVRETAIELLAEIGTPDALAALAATLDDPDIDSRLATVYELADSDSVPASALLQRFVSDNDPMVGNLATELLDR